MQRRPGWADMLNKNKFHTGLLNLRLHGGCNRSSHSGVCVRACVLFCLCARMYAYLCACVYLFMYCLARQPQQLNVECEWVRMKLEKKKKKLDELQSIGAGSLY